MHVSVGLDQNYEFQFSFFFSFFFLFFFFWGGGGGGQKNYYFLGYEGKVNILGGHHKNAPLRIE